MLFRSRRCDVYANSKRIEDIDTIVYNDHSHIACLFKEYLIYYDTKDLFQHLYSTQRSKKLLRNSANANQKRFIYSTYRIHENPDFKKSLATKQKIRHIKREDMKYHGKVSTFFHSTCIRSLARDDLSNSISHLPANSLDCSKSEDMIEVLNKMFVNEKGIKRNNNGSLNHKQGDKKAESAQRKNGIFNKRKISKYKQNITSLLLKPPGMPHLIF